MPSLIDWHDIDDSVWNRCVERALAHYRDRTWNRSAAGKALGLLFFNPSLRTRTSMELAGEQLGAHVTAINAGEGVWGFEWKKGAVMDGDRAEHIREAVGVLSRYYDALGARVFASLTDYEADRNETLLKTLAESATVPVINMESAFFHPCQALGDAATMFERLGGNPAGKRFLLTWAYHPKALPMAVPNSALLTATRLGMNVTLAHPEGFELDETVMERARNYVAGNGGSLEMVHDQQEAFKGADVVYAKAWAGRSIYVDRGREEATRVANRNWRVTESRMKQTNNAAFMHCLPVRRNVVVDDAVLDGPSAIHLLQAEFRLHAQKAILEYVWDLY